MKDVVKTIFIKQNYNNIYFYFSNKSYILNSNKSYGYIFMKKIKVILLIPIMSFPILSLISCSSTSSSQEKENSNKNDKLDSDDISKNLTDDQVLYIDKENVDIFISKFPNLLSNNGVLDLSIFKNLEEIRESAFIGRNIKSIIFNNKVSKIEKYAFKGMFSLKGFTIPDSLTFIGEEAFLNAFSPSIETTLIFDQNSKIKLIGNNAFSNNEKLQISISNESIKELLIQSQFNQNKIISNINNSSGYFNGLYIDKYLSIISSLNINKNSVLSLLTNDNLNEQLNKKFPNKNYQLNILENTSEYEGILNLKLSFDGIQENITITGFNSLKNNVNYIINKLVINSDKWYSDLKKESEVNAWNKDQWVSYLSNLEIRDDNNIPYDLLKIGNNVSYVFEYNSTKKTMFVILTSNYKKYNGTNWVNETNNILNKKIGILNNTGFPIEFPSKNNLYDFIKNILQVKESIKNSMITSRYASYYSHAFNGLKLNTLLNNILEIPDKYLTYIKENLMLSSNDVISIEFSNVFSNDVDGILNFNYDFKKRNNIDSTLFSGSYQINGFKKITKNDLSTTMSINKDSSLFQSNLKQINNVLSKEQLKNMESNQSIELNNFGFGLINNQINLLIDGNDEQSNSKKTKFEQLIKNYSILIKNSILESNSIDFNTNYFNDGNNNDDTRGYIIKYLSISVNKSIKAKISKTHIWTYSFPITISIGIANANNFVSESISDMEIESNCTMTILSSDIDKLLK